ncbi:MAG: hypothetical protein WC840_00650 [Candidatus Peribacteraceae bacterium]
MTFRNVCIIGHTGNVGRELVRQIDELDGPDRQRNPTRIIALANSTCCLIDPCGIKQAARFTDKTAFNEAAKPYDRLEEILDHLQMMGRSAEIVFVDVTGEKNEAMLEFHHNVLDRGEKIATANKNPIALYSMEDFCKLTNRPDFYRYNASVMAGGDAIPYIQDAVNISDQMRSIEGCFSGTLGFICSRLQDGERFSDCVRTAYESKFTEPHPWDDLSGLDVARKILILARTAGFSVDLKDIEVTPFIPKHFGEIESVETFLKELRSLDDFFMQRMNAAGKKVLRYVAQFRNEGGPKPLISVGLREVDREDWLGHLKGSANLIRITTDMRAPESSPHIIIAKGAGIEKTAGAIRADLARF